MNFIYVHFMYYTICLSIRGFSLIFKFPFLIEDLRSEYELGINGMIIQIWEV